MSFLTKKTIRIVLGRIVITLPNVNMRSMVSVRNHSRRLPQNRMPPHWRPALTTGKPDCLQSYIVGMEAPPFEYRYRAGNPQVIDGDTVDCDVDLGFGIQTRRRFRLLGINAPEKRKPTYDAGIAAKQHLESLLELYGLSEVRTHKDRTGKYGRMLATLIGVDGSELIDLNQRMIDDGHAEPM